MLPPQHGAWAMLLLPYTIGVIRAGWTWVQVPLLVAWLSGYLLSYFALLAIKTGRFRRYRVQFAVYGAVAAAGGLTALVARPWLAVMAPALVALLGVNAWYARQRRDRALASGLASVLQSCLLVPLTAIAAGIPPARTIDVFAGVLLYFTGTLLYVKTMIRERDDPRYLRASIGFHALAVPVAALAWLPLAAPFGWFLARALLLPRKTLTPKQVGLIEVAGSVALGVLLAVPH